MRSVEVSAVSLEEARKAAAFQLGVAEEEIEIEVLQAPRKLFGLIGSGQYLIRATYDEEQAPTGKPPAAEEVPAEAVPVAEEAEDVEPAPAWEEPEPGLERRFPPAPPVEQPEDSRRAVAERAQQLTEDITALMGIDAEVVIANVGADQVELEINGAEAMGLIIGAEGSTRDALQLIVAIGANRGIEDGCRVVIDTEDYRARHEERLRGQAREAAEEAKQSGREVVIDDLGGYERRIVHMELHDDPDVETYSEGDERDRRLVVSPITHE